MRGLPVGAVRLGISRAGADRLVRDLALKVVAVLFCLMVVGIGSIWRYSGRMVPPIQRLHEAFTSGPLKDVRIDADTFARALRLYHQMEGWDPETGWPTFAKLAELGIEWAARPGDTW